MTSSRRTLLKAAAGAAVVASPLAFLFRREARADHGPLVPDPLGVLDLAPGFGYSILQRSSDAMSDGYQVPGRPDGMACFAGPSGTLTLMRNHELDRGYWEAGYDTAPAESFDATAGGGVTRLVLREKTLEVVSSNRVLAGTLRNCSGGHSPWGWLSCEESVEAGHGYVFRCRTDAARLARPERIVGYGRFRHEAACVDPRTLTAFLTEDQKNGCLYRYRPTDRARPHDSGTLQALRVRGAPHFDTGRDLAHGTKLEVDWVDIRDPDPKDDSVRQQASAAGAATFCRGEGMFLKDDVVYVCCTSGGRRGAGQVFRLTLGGAANGDRLELFAESPGSNVLDMPDNLFVTAWGDVLLAEDGSGEQFLRGITPDGRIYTLARNARSSGEFAGICASPSGDTLFVNLHIDGLTLAITGSFDELRRNATLTARRST